MNYTKPVLNGQAAMAVIRGGDFKLTGNPEMGGFTDPAYEADE